MSDIEDYAYSPYDDLEDILYDADPAPELADDLAEHALHSPVYLDEIAGYELQEYFSDWEYYSDDYMDDDPVLEKGVYTEHRSTVKRGKKRKLVETKDIPALDLNETKLILRSIKGTVWAKPGNTDPPIHNVGQDETISLMKDWKQIFSIKDDGWGRRTSADDNDESWAKDMSLADMGLQPLQNQKSFEQENTQEGDDSDDEGNEDEGEVDIEEIMDDGIDLRAIDPTPENEQTHPSVGNSTMPTVKRRASTLNQTLNATTIDNLYVSEDENPRKRRRYKPELPSPPNSSESVAIDAGDIPNRAQAQIQPDTNQPGKANRKRKASEEPLEGESIARSTAGTRAKRATKTSANGIHDTNSRPTRHNKHE